jgi:hypothetical protein
MNIRLIDRHRGVTMLPKPPYVAAMRGVSGDPFLALDDLLERAGNVANGQHEFECDQEFYGALTNAAVADPETTYSTDVDMAFVPWKPGHSATYKGVPVIVDQPAKPQEPAK